MKKMNETKITRYSLNEGFYADIVETADYYEAWLGREPVGVQSLMFGCPKAQQTRKEFLDLVLWNYGDYAEMFCEEYCEE